MPLGAVLEGQDSSSPSFVLYKPAMWRIRNNLMRIPLFILMRIRIRIFFVLDLCFASGVGFPLFSTLRFSTLFHNDPAAHQDHCGRCRIRTPNLCPRSLVRILLSWRIIKNYAKFFSLSL